MIALGLPAAAVAAGLVLTMRVAAAQSPQQIVDQFYPVNTLPVDRPEQRRSCFAIYQSDGTGPTTLVAGYTNAARGYLRVLTRDATGAFRVAAETPSSLMMLGDGCTVTLEDVDGDQATDILVNLRRRAGDETWIFRWTGTQLENRTPTEPDEGAAVVSALVNATVLDLAHDGSRQVYVNQTSPDADEPQTRANQLFTNGPTGFVFNRDVLAAARFVVVRPPDRHAWTTFRAIANRPGPYTLRIVNGAPNGLRRVTGATVALNDVVLVGPGQLGAGVEFLTVPFTATLGDFNDLDLDLTGPAGSFLTILIDFPPTP
jgi:hypothetical protein